MFCHRSALGCRSLLAAMTLVTALRAQTDAVDVSTDPILSLSRLHVHISSAFTSAPWGDLNESYSLARDAINYSAFHLDPRGHVDQVNGDVSLELRAGYRVLEGLSLFLGGMYLENTASLSYSESSPYESSSPPRLASIQSLSLTIRGFVVGCEYGFRGSIPLVVHAGIGRAFGQIGFLGASTSPGVDLSFRALLRDGNQLFLAGARATLLQLGPLSFEAGVSYRRLRFPSMRGTGIATMSWDTGGREKPIHASLVRRGAYFGITTSNQPWASWQEEDALHRPWRYAPNAPQGIAPRQSILDLGGFGISGGIVVVL